MRQIIFPVCLLLSLLLGTAESATAQSSEVYRAIYQVRGSYTPQEAVDKGSYTEAVLEIYPDRSFFFDRWFQVGDSVYQASLDLDGDMLRAAQAKRRTGVAPGLKIGVKSFFADNNRETYHVIGVDLYCYEEELNRPAWEVMQDSTAVKKGYNCIMAKADYLGREWIVWYTPDIPSPTGPWKLWGLPGLIVEAKDSEGLFFFALSSFAATTPKKPYGDFSKYKNAWPRRKMGKKKQVLESFAFSISDPVGYLHSAMPGRIKRIEDKDGREISGAELRTKFIYIEK